MSRFPDPITSRWWTRPAAKKWPAFRWVRCPSATAWWLFRKMRAGSLYLGPALLLVLASSAAAQSEWLTWGHDQERTGWNKSETTLSKDNASKLGLKWV